MDFRTNKDGTVHPLNLPVTHPLSSSILENDTKSPESRKRRLKGIGSILFGKSKSYAKRGIQAKRDYDEKQKVMREERTKVIHNILNNKDKTTEQKFLELQGFAHEHKKKLTSGEIFFINMHLKKLEELSLKQYGKQKKEQKEKQKKEDNEHPRTFAEMDEPDSTPEEPKPEEPQQEPTPEPDSSSNFAEGSMNQEDFDKLPEGLKAEIKMHRARSKD